MRIGIDASRANIHQKTGTEWYAFFLIEELKKIAQPRNHFVLYSKEPLIPPLQTMPRNFSSSVLRWPPKFLWTQIRLAGEMLRRRPDCLFIPTHTVPIVAPRNTVVTIHDVGFERYPELYSSKQIGPSNPLLQTCIHGTTRLLTAGKYCNTELDYHRWSVRLALKKARVIITISEFSKRELLTFYDIKPDKIEVIPIAYNPIYQFLPGNPRFRHVQKKYNIPDKFFLSIGRLEEKKNTKKIVEAFLAFHRAHPLEKYQLVLVGSPGYGFQNVQNIIAKNGLLKFVSMMGWVNTEDLPVLMNAAKGFIFPSMYEGFGMPILEAMACGIPVITSNRGALQEVAANAALCVNPDHTDEIFRAMNAIVKEPSIRNHYIESGFRRIRQFSWKKTAERTHAVLTRQE
ncbi:MAG: glycosyltransferase family 1 protein [Patescibacteria group bacterium]|nr:glycosyltransferase family 1 protein [Patescibacteria group bacterium]